MEPAHFEALYPEDTRSEEIKKILEFVKSGRAIQIVGLPGTGRSNLLGLLSYNKQVRLKHLGENNKWFHFVYMDFSEVRKRPAYDVIKFILISTAYSLSERERKAEYETVNKFLKEAINFQDEMILFQALKKTIDYLAIEKELTIVFLFDRFEQYIPNISEEFFLNLKILRNRAKYRFSCIFSLNRPLEDVVEPFIFTEFNEFLEGNIVYLRVYDPIGIEFRFSYLEKVTGKKADAQTKKELIALTGGHGKISRLAYESVLSEDGKISDLKYFLLQRSVINKSLSQIWDYLSPAEQNFLRVKAKTEKENKDYKYLENIGLLKNGKIAIPLFEEYIKTAPVEKTENIRFDAEKNEILKGAEQITERLSPSEFRLLRFMLLNPDKICEKDEIIQAVWKDSKTQEGVTDQALDQIIYRLRKKIEDDPNNPTHLITIKGRGFKFIP